MSTSNNRPFRRLGVIGAGNMGSGIAQKMATEGFDVVMVDLDYRSHHPARTKAVTSHNYILLLTCFVGILETESLSETRAELENISDFDRLFLA